MSKTCFCCEQERTLKEYPILEVNVCDRCYHVINRIGGPQLQRIDDPVPPAIKQRFISAVKRMKLPKKGDHHA